MLRAVIFQCEGVLLDNAAQSAQAWRSLAEEWLRPEPPSDDALRAIAGRSVADALPDFIAQWFPHREFEETLQKRAEHYYHAVREQPVTIVPGARALVDALRARNVTVACVSAGLLDLLLFHLHETQLLDAFETCVGGDEVEHGPPAPELPHEAAVRLHVAPSECVAIDCTPAGIAGARAGGMGSVGVCTVFGDGELQDADVVVGDMPSLTVETLMALRRS